MRIEVRGGDADLRPCLLDARDGALEIVVARERPAHEVLEGRVAEHLPPREVRERGRLRRADPAAEILRRLDRRSPVLRPDLETPEPAEEAPRLGRWRAAREEDHRGHGGACAAHHALTCSCAGTAPGALGRASTRRGDQR